MAAASMVILPQRYIIILPARLDELISALHEADRADHAADLPQV
jgi:hypothetical protein